MTDPKAKKKGRSKIETLSLIVKLGHSAFEGKNRDAVLMRITDASVALVRYDNACVADIGGGRAKILAVTGFPPSDLNRDSEYCRNAAALLRPFAGRAPSKALLVDDSELEERSASRSAKDALKWFRESGFESILLIPMPPPPVSTVSDGALVWMLEFRKRPLDGEISSLALLAKHYAEALWLATPSDDKRSWRGFLSKPRRATWLTIALLAIVALFLVRPRLTANARFEVGSLDRSVARAPLPGVVDNIALHNGAKVECGDIVVHLDSDEAALGLAKAEKALESAKTALDVARKASFEKNAELGKLKLLKLDMEKAKIDADIARWRLREHDIRAGSNGLLVFDDERKLLGAKVTRGDKLFSVVDPARPVARILLDEKDAEALSGGTPFVTLYFHASPGQGVDAKVVSISPKPVLMNDNRFRYVIKAVPATSAPPVVFGASGTAKVKGPRRALAYHFLRNFIIWWREW